MGLKFENWAIFNVLVQISGFKHALRWRLLFLITLNNKLTVALKKELKKSNTWKRNWFEIGKFLNFQFFDIISVLFFLS